MFLTLTPAEKLAAEQIEGESDEAWCDRLRTFLMDPLRLVDYLDAEGKRPADLPPDWRERSVSDMGLLSNPIDVHAVYRELAFRPSTQLGRDSLEGPGGLAARLVSFFERAKADPDQPSGRVSRSAASVPVRKRKVSGVRQEGANGASDGHDVPNRRTNRSRVPDRR